MPKMDANDVGASIGPEGLAKQLEAKTAEAKPEKKKDPTQSEILVGLASEADLFHTPEHEPHAVLRVNGHAETWRVKSNGFRRWLVGQFFQQTSQAPGAQALQNALGVIEARAVYSGPECPVFNRLARHEGRVYLDLADELWRVVEIGPEGWRVLSESPVRFVRPKSMLPLPEPKTGGSLSELRPLINCPGEQEWAIVLAWLVGCLNPQGPYPVLAVNGEQASAKSTLCKMLKLLVDPSKAPLRSEPKEARDLMIAACNGWVYVLDNVSGIPNWLSDALCRLATGAGYGTRELYENDGEAVFDACRPLMLNGIEDLATRSDLLDRCLSLCLPTIPEQARMEEGKLWPRFHAAQPRILGALLDAASAALRNKDTVILESLPRMADHARWAVGAEAALGLKPGVVLAAIEEARADANATALESSLVANAALAFMDSRGTWEGTATELMRLLEQQLDAADGAGGSDRKPWKRPQGWPLSPKGMATAMRRLAPNLRRVGLDVTFDKKETRRVIRLSRVIEDSSAAPETADSEPPRVAQAFVPKLSSVDDDEDCVPARQATVDEVPPF